MGIAAGVLFFVLKKFVPAPADSATLDSVAESVDQLSKQAQTSESGKAILITIVLIVVGMFHYEFQSALLLITHFLIDFETFFPAIAIAGIIFWLIRRQASNSTSTRDRQGASSKSADTKTTAKEGSSSSATNVGSSTQ